MDSILISIKKLLGIAAEYTHFDDDIKIHINSVFMILNQLGIGPSAGFHISDESAVWSDFITNEDIQIEAVKTFIYLKVRLMFDPPTTSGLLESTNRQINELEWRLTTMAESINFDEEEV